MSHRAVKFIDLQMFYFKPFKNYILFCYLFTVAHGECCSFLFSFKCQVICTFITACYSVKIETTTADHWHLHLSNVVLSLVPSLRSNQLQ